MSLMLDSKAHFSDRLKTLGLGEFETKFVNKGWCTMAAFGFSSSYVPGRSDETVLVEKVFKPILGNADHVLEPMVRRLFFEAYTVAAADITRRVTNPDTEEKPRKLPLVERAERLTALSKLLPGLCPHGDILGELLPSNALIDKCVDMFEVNELRYIRWEELTKRDQEQRGVKREGMWQEDERGNLKRVYVQGEITTSVEDHLLLKCALQRRGVALHVAELLTFKVHEALIGMYFEEMAREPLHGYAKVSVDQVRRTDQAIFKRLGEKTTAGFRHLKNGDTLCLDGLLAKVLEEPRVLTLIVPLQNAGQAKQAKEPRANTSELDSLRAQVKRLQAEVKGKGKDAGKKGKSKDSAGSKNGRQSGKRSGPRLPKELIGCEPMVNGHPVCFDYNMSQGCSHRGVPFCSKGSHKCCNPACAKGEGDDHSYAKCPKR